MDGASSGFERLRRKRVIVMGQVILGVCRYGTFQAGVCLINLAFTKIGHAERGMGHRKIWIEFQCLFKIGVGSLRLLWSSKSPR